MAHEELSPLNITPGAIRFNTDSMKLEYFRIGMEGGSTSSYAGIGTLAAGEWVQITTDSPDIQTGGTRGLNMGGIIAPARTDAVDYITISTTGNSLDFGTLVQSASQGAGLGSRTRAIAGGGTPSTPSGTDNIDTHEIASTGNFTDFGDFTEAGMERNGISNSTRGVFLGRQIPPNAKNTIEYITISSTGEGIDFGDLPSLKVGAGAAGNSTRGIHAGGNSPGFIAIDYITINTLGNSADFGDLISALTNTRGGNCGSSTRGLMAGGSPSGDTIQYLTIQTLGNSIDFGNLTSSKSQIAHMSSTTRAVFAGDGSGTLNVIDYVQVQTTGNAIDFGDLDANNGYSAGASNGHGGLG